MPKTGEFQKTKYGFSGHILLREGRYKVDLYQIENSGEDRPNYEVKAPNGADIGVGFDRIGKDSKKPYVRVHIDDMTMAQPISGNLVHDGYGKWSLISQRSPRSMGRDNGETQEVDTRPPRRQKSRDDDAGMER